VVAVPGQSWPCEAHHRRYAQPEHAGCRFGPVASGFPADRGGRVRAEQGESLVELLVAIMIMGIAVTAVLGEVMMSASSSRMYQGVTQAREFLHVWGEAIDKDPYVVCPSVSSSGIATPPGLVAASVAVEIWKDGGFVPSGLVSSCPKSDSGLQRWTLSVTAPGAGLPSTTQKLVLVKRNPCTSTSQVGCSP
jgi:hypothetical protein